jgi:hypothetical protein
MSKIVIAPFAIITADDPVTCTIYARDNNDPIPELDNGEILTTELLAIIATDDPIARAIYAKNNDLLEIYGWKRSQGITKHEKKFLLMVFHDKHGVMRMSPRHTSGK